VECRIYHTEVLFTWGVRFRYHAHSLGELTKSGVCIRTRW